MCLGSIRCYSFFVFPNVILSLKTHNGIYITDYSIVTKSLNEVNVMPSTLLIPGNATP